MQEILADIVRGIGLLVLRAATLGRYRGSEPADVLPEGAIGFATVLAIAYVIYRIL